MVKKNCRVCGKEYELCRNVKDGSGIFHYQEVSCSPECGAEYLRQVMEARNPSLKKKAKAAAKKVAEAVASDEMAASVAESMADNE